MILNLSLDLTNEEKLIWRNMVYVMYAGMELNTGLGRIIIGVLYLQCKLPNNAIYKCVERGMGLQEGKQPSRISSGRLTTIQRGKSREGLYRRARSNVRIQ